MKTKTLVRKTKERGNHPSALVHILRCDCGDTFGRDEAQNAGQSYGGG